MSGMWIFESVDDNKSTLYYNKIYNNNNNLFSYLVFGWYSHNTT